MGENRSILDNQELAILTRVNDLAERWGIKPYEFLADIVSYGESDSQRLSLEYAMCPKTLEAKEQFFRMMSSLGISGADWAIDGTANTIIDALDNAMQLAPKHRVRDRNS